MNEHFFSSKAMFKSHVICKKYVVLRHKEEILRTGQRRWEKSQMM